MDGRTTTKNCRKDSAIELERKTKEDELAAIAAEEERKRKEE